MKTEVRNGLISKYPAAVNCDLMAPPKINPEVKAAIHEGTLKRDDRFVAVQAMLGASLSALGQSITTLLTDTPSEYKTKLLSTLGDAARLIAAAHAEQSQARRAILRNHLSKDVEVTLSEATSAEGWLFGINLSERIQSAKALEKTTSQLKKLKEATTGKFKAPTSTARSSGNLNRPSRQNYQPLRRDGRKDSAVARKQGHPRVQGTSY